MAVYTSVWAADDDDASVTREIQQLSQAIRSQPGTPELYVKRGDAYFLIHDFDKSVADYTMALKIDDHQDMAYFGRGLALGRQGLVEDGIADLTVYIKRHPDNSRAYTKRGVRHLWLNQRKAAKQDLQKAIELDPKNAEAHDDLGVIYAQLKDYKTALEHFTTAVKIDPTYQKAHHNMAMDYYILGQDELALLAVNNSLHLNPNARNSLMLKAQILRSLGHESEAQKVEDEAEFLPEGNWHERAQVE